MARPASSGPAAVVVDPVGRNGVHEYDDQDHSMVTVEDIAGGGHDVRAVDVAEDHHEDGRAPSSPGSGRDAPVLPRRRLRAA